MKPSLLGLLFFLFAFHLHAQRPGGSWGGSEPSITGSIQGQIVDSLTGEPVEFATLLLKRLPPQGPGPGANRGENAGGSRPPQAQQGQESDSLQRARIVERMTQRLGRTPTEEEIQQAIERFAGRAPGAPTNISTEPEQVDGQITDENGDFKFTEVKLGRYIIEASFIGYDKKIIRQIELTGKNPDVNLSAVKLGSSAALLAEAVVIGEAELIENRVDKIVYNASQDVANQGGDGADVLRRVPLLSVDLDGNVQLRGSSQVQILINGRPSTMFAGSIGEALQAMPAEEIEKVEVVTSPGARYQGEGTAGIINIITKRGGLKGLTGNTNASIGTRSNNVGANLSYAKGRFGINGGLGSRFSWNRPTTTSSIRVDSVRDINGDLLGLRTLEQAGKGNSNWTGLNGNIGAFYDLNAFNSFTTSLRMRGRNRFSDISNLSTQSFPEGNEFNQFSQDRLSRGPSYNFDWSTDYKRKYKGEDHELNVAAQVGASIRNNNYELLIDSQAGTVNERDERGLNEGQNLEYTLQADYQRPLNPKLFLETGGQAILRKLTSIYDYESRPYGQEVPYTIDQNRSNIFDYDQDVAAAYVSFRSTISEKLSAIAGVRYEYTAIRGERRRPQPGESPFSNEYNNYLPSASLQYKLSMSSNVRVAYTKRIQRPGLNYVNPFTDQTDALAISIGNPTLLPEISDQYELTTNGRVGKGFFNFSVFYKQVTDQFSSISIRNLSTGVLETSFLNLGQSDSYGSSVFASYTIAKIIKIRGGINAERQELNGTGRFETLSRNVWQYGMNGSLTAELPNDIVIESFGFYRAPEQTLQGEQASFSIWSIGAQKKLMEDRWRVGIRIVEPFARSKEFPGFQSGEGFNTRTEYSVLFRSFGINVNYRFGKLEGNTPRERRSKINNNDVREGGGGGEF